MEPKNICSKAYLLIIFFSISLFSVAQTKENNKNLLQGKWVLENVCVDDTGRTLYIDSSSNYGEFYSGIEIKENTIYLEKDEIKNQEVKYEVDGNFLGFDLSSGQSFIAEWAVLDDKLYLEFSSSDPYNTSKKIKILLIYTKNK